MEYSAAFYRNYFVNNALERYTNSLQEFMFRRRGSFLPPHKKSQYIKIFLAEEQEHFNKNGFFSLPSVQFAITTRCTLRCRDCSAMIPRFASPEMTHCEMSLVQFRQNLDALLAAVDHVRSFLILGGEPLMHRELAHMVAYAASQEKIGLVDVVTNCTILPGEDLLNALQSYRHKAFMGLSNYSRSKDASALVKRDAIIRLLKERDIKHSLDTGTGKWLRYSLEKCDINEEALKSVFANCQWHHCLYVLGDELGVSPRSLVGQKLGAFSLGDGDKISLGAEAGIDIRKKLLDFFEKDTLDACRYCRRHTELAEPAIQMK